MECSLLRGAKIWLVVLLIVNGAVAVAMQGDVRQWLATRMPPEESPVPESGSNGWICAAWGPFADAALMRPSIAEIEAAGGSADVVGRGPAATPYFLLLVGPQGSFDAARRVREELESQSIESHIVPRGPFARSLEVGVYSNRTEARVQQTLIEELGYDTDLREMEHPEIRFHVVARLRREAAEILPPASDCGAVAPGHGFL